jgi:hypothetical protein
MTKANLYHQCKLCSLIKVNRDWFIEVHRRILDEGEAKTVVCRWLNNKVEEHNNNTNDKSKHLVKYNANNFTRHFQKHISDSDKFRLKLKEHLVSKPEKGSTSFSENEKSVADASVSGVSIEVDEFKQLNDMITSLEDNLKKYNDQISERGGGIPITSLETYQRLVVNLIKAKRDLTQLKNSSKIAGIAIEDTLETALRQFFNELVKVTEEVEDILNKSIPSSSIPKETMTIIRSRMSGSVKEIVPEVVEKVKKVYSIK